MIRILLLIEHHENRRLLRETLAAQYQISEGEELASEFDVCILDGPSLERLWADIEDRKQAEAPLFLPFLLLTTRQQVDMVTRHLWRAVDEVLYLPIQEIELSARVAVLSRARCQARQNEDLSARKALQEELLAMVCHDLKNPLNIIQLSAEVLLQASDPPARQLTSILQAAERMNRLLGDTIAVKNGC